jgi:hypothetical protein
LTRLFPFSIICITAFAAYSVDVEPSTIIAAETTYWQYALTISSSVIGRLRFGCLMASSNV